MKKYILVLLLGLSLGLPAIAQDMMRALHPIRVDVVYLASDYLQGRETGTDYERLAAEYIARRFEALGLSPKGENGSWYQDFEFKFSNNPHASAEEGAARTGRNVVGYIDNGAKQTVVVGAHYDHLGHGITGSLDPNSTDIHNGADDNASGIAGMLYIAEALKSSSAKNNNYLFLAFSGEELGLLGSKAYVKAASIPVEEMNYMINLDMIGRLKMSKNLALSGTGTSPAWEPAFEALEGLGFTLAKTKSGVGPSDHTSFYLQDVPAIHFFTGAHDDYHKPTDDANLVNYVGILQISDYVVKLIEELDDDGELEFTATKNDDNKRQAAAFKVTLGVMPDYSYADSGMRIDAVIDDRPAANAGLENGDIVVQIGDMEIGDIYDYMEALSKFEKGQKANVVVKRGKKKIKKSVTF